MSILDLPVKDFTTLLLSYDYDIYNPLLEKLGLIDELMIYNYIDSKTDGLGKDRLAIIKDVMETRYNTIILLHNLKPHSHDSFYKYAISLINDKLGVAEPQLNILTDKAKKYLQKAIEAGLMVGTETGYHWNKSKVLLAYFIDIISDKCNENYNLRASNGKIRWNVFKPLFGIDKNDNSLRDAVNEYKNKSGQLPIGHEIVDSL